MYCDWLKISSIEDNCISVQEDASLQKYKKLNEAIVGIVEDYSLVSFVPLMVEVSYPLPDMPVLGSSNSAAKKDGDTIIRVENIVGKEKLLITSNFSFSHNVFKRCLLLLCQNEYLWTKGLN